MLPYDGSVSWTDWLFQQAPSTEENQLGTKAQSRLTYLTVNEWPGLSLGIAVRARKDPTSSGWWFKITFKYNGERHEITQPIAANISTELFVEHDLPKIFGRFIVDHANKGPAPVAEALASGAKVDLSGVTVAAPKVGAMTVAPSLYTVLDAVLCGAWVILETVLDQGAPDLQWSIYDDVNPLYLESKPIMRVKIRTKDEVTMNRLTLLLHQPDAASQPPPGVQVHVTHVQNYYEYATVYAEAELQIHGLKFFG